MKRAPIIEDWSRFNRAVLEIADNPPQPAPQPPKREPTGRVPEPGGHSDSLDEIARPKWRKL